MLHTLMVAAMMIAQPFPPPAASPPVAPAAPKPATVRVALTTADGPIVLELEKERAPITTANFLHYVDTKRFDGISFYRAVNVAPGFGLLQGGVGRDGKRLYKPIAHEPTTITHLTHDDGAISMGMNAPGSATADFFIVVGGFPSMDATATQPGFAAFGHVIQGMDLVKRYLAAPVSPTAGEGAMKGQMIAAPIQIITARRVPGTGE